MATPWPGTLPAGFLVSVPMQREGRGNAVRTETISGRIKMRRKSSKTQQRWNVSIALTEAQVATFDTFYRTTLAEGTLPFQGINHPISGANTVWAFLEDPTTESYPSSTNLYRVSFALLALPDAPT